MSYRAADRSLEEASKLAMAELTQQANYDEQPGPGRKGFGKGEDGSMDRLFVSRVPQSVSKEDLRAYFSQFGELTDVYLPAPRRLSGGRRRGPRDIWHWHAFAGSRRRRSSSSSSSSSSS
ncbi:unnamed protein product, partial [Prorocentrum cordatum]